MTFQRKMKRTVPGSDQVVLVRKLPGANIATANATSGYRFCAVAIISLEISNPVH